MTAETDTAPAPRSDRAARSSACRRCCCRSPPTARSTGRPSSRCSRQTVDAGLVPAVNMDTGYVQLLDADTRDARARTGAAAQSGPAGFVAGAFVADEPGAPFDLDAYLLAIERDRGARRHAGGVPVVRPQRARRRGVGRGARGVRAARRPVHRVRARPDVRALRPHLLARRVRRTARRRELHRRQALVAVARGRVGPPRAPRPRPPRLPRVHRQRPRHRHGLLRLRLPARALGVRARGVRRARPALGGGDRAFHELNDLLQYLGAFAFRAPVPAYRHDAALFLQLRGWIASDATPPGRRGAPTADRAVLADIAAGSRRCCDRRHRAGEAAAHARRAARPAARCSASPSSWASTMRSTPTGRSRRRFTYHRRLRRDAHASATASRCCRWRAGTASADGAPTDLVRRRWRRFGDSGAKLVWGGEAVAVATTGGPTRTSS